MPDEGGFEPALKALIETIAAWPRRVTVIAGADLAHVGPEFGDEDPVSDALLADVHRQDREVLDLIAAGNAEGFLRSFIATQNSRRVCSIACIHTLLRCLPVLGATQGRVLNYIQSTRPNREGTVTHTGLVFV
jgi:AmmeMemoRadiSam system protein B